MRNVDLTGTSQAFRRGFWDAVYEHEYHNPGLAPINDPSACESYDAGWRFGQTQRVWHKALDLQRRLRVA